MRTYPIIASAPYCCVAASLEAILKRHGFDKITQFDIANYIGLVAFDNDRSKLPKELTNVTFTNESDQVGLHLKNNTLNDFFIAFDLPFQELYIYWHQISDLNIDSILMAIHEDCDAMLLFDSGSLYRESKNRGIGHSGVFVSINDHYTVTYLSPGPRSLGLESFTSEDFAEAIKARHGGISIISRK